MTENDKYLVACVKAEIPTQRIAEKLSIAPGEVVKRYDAIQKAQEGFLKVGIDGLESDMLALTFQYNLMGEKLKNVCHHLSNPVMPHEIEALLTDDPEETVKNLLAAFIIMHPYITPKTETPLPEGP